MEVIVRKPTPQEAKAMETLPVWECKPSSFNWYYDNTETSLVSHGRAEVEYDGQKVSFGAGDLVVFPKGLKCIWTIEETVVKHYQLSGM